MKHLVETNGAYMFLDPETRTEIHATRPTVVKSNNFVEARVAEGQLKILGANISDEATDEEFLAYWAENKKIAVDAFLAEFGEAGEDPIELGVGPHLVESLKAAVDLLEEGDFQKDGKPKVGALNKIVDGVKVTTEIRDAFWEAQAAD